MTITDKELETIIQNICWAGAIGEPVAGGLDGRLALALRESRARERALAEELRIEHEARVRGEGCTEKCPTKQLLAAHDAAVKEETA